MPWTVDWIDRELHICDATVSDPFTPADQSAFLLLGSRPLILPRHRCVCCLTLAG